jgi:hypothetical protein
MHAAPAAIEFRLQEEILAKGYLSRSLHKWGKVLSVDSFILVLFHSVIVAAPLRVCLQLYRSQI